MTGRAPVIDFQIFLNCGGGDGSDYFKRSYDINNNSQGVTTQHSPSELQDRLGGGGDVAVRPGEEVELSHRPRLPSLAVLQVERPHQVVLAPHVLRHQVDLQQQQQQH